MRNKKTLDALAALLVKQNNVQAQIIKSLVEVAKLMPSETRGHALDAIQGSITAFTEESEVIQDLLLAMSEERQHAE
jgi:hypothetical protein